MVLRCRDKRRLCTVPWSRVIDFRSGANPAGQWLSASNAACRPYVEGWQMVCPAGEGPVAITYRFDAPARRRFAWAYVHASVREGPAGQPQRQATLQWSTDGRRWRRLARIAIPNTHLQWDGSIDGEVRFSRPARSVRLRIISDTPVSGFEFHGHLAERAADRDRLLITHRWREGERACAFEAPAGKRRYVVTCGSEPKDHAIEMRVSSRRRRSKSR